MTTRRFLLAIAAAAAAVPYGRVARADPTLATLAGFNTANGADPNAGLVIDAAGNLYGTTAGGGSAGDGTAFELPAAARTNLVTVGTFNGGNGMTPNGLAIDPAGNLFGTAQRGGSYADGTVFKLVVGGQPSVLTLDTFAAANGQYPQAPVTSDAAGNLFGTTYQGGPYGVGTVFEVDAASRGLTTVVTFNTSSGGQHPAAGLVADAAGNLYGTTSTTAFELSGTGHQTVTTLATFTGGNGAVPSGLTIDPAGNLYGTTNFGGTGGVGTAFELSGPTHQTLTTLATFAGANGSQPAGGLTVDAAGNLYGTTFGGGAGNAGTVFQLSGPTHQTLTTLASFSSANGSGPSGSLAVDGAGDVFGTTAAGGPGGQGTAFELSNAGFVLPAVTVANGSAYHVAPPSVTATAPQIVNVLGITVGAGATVSFDPALFHIGRQLVVVGSGRLSFVRSGTRTFGRLDVANNDLTLVADVLAGTSDLATTTAEVAEGYNGGDWNGAGGITSSTAAADPTRTTALGVIQNNQSGTAIYTATNPYDGYVPGPGDVLVKYTYYGDANLDGKVDGQDYGRIDAGYLSGGTQTGWYNGDFNYDGRVDGSDYTLIDNGFDKQAGNLSTATAGLTAAGTDEVAAVPEPAGIAVVAVSIGVLRCRRRRANRRPPS